MHGRAFQFIVTRFYGILLDIHHESENQNCDTDGLHAEYHPSCIKNVNETHCVLMLSLVTLSL